MASVALDLFNSHGYTPVTTNWIAEACGVSTGSLYYHFRNREDVLWHLFQHVDALVRPLFVTPDFAETGMDLLHRQLSEVAPILCDYRFFFPDQSAILRRDARVADAFAALHADCVAAMDRQLAATLRPAGPAAPDTLALARSIWILVTGWVTYLYMRREPVTPETVAGVAPLIAGLLAPYVPA
ncbi:TetR/AcrR family transcriptional regulator [Zavarzinia sp.]|uniref:TetR/AcrR family transcriptional regulator n=1 Tax=Zavarzinia sp. TaxID=2027920 RepID=UPI0035689D93